MLDMPRQMVRASLTTTAATTLATVPFGVIWIVKNIQVLNSSGSTLTPLVSLAGLPFLQVSISAGSTYSLATSQVLTAGQTIVGSGNGLHLHIAGIEVAL